MKTAYKPLHLNKWSLVQYKIMDTSASFIWIIFLFDGAFKYNNGAKFGVMLGQALNHCTEFCN
jgi:hypothetical protein